MDGHRSTVPSWAVPTSCSGTATTRCWRGLCNCAPCPTSSAANMEPAGADWRSDRLLWIELFVLFNFAGLVIDIFLAHSQNRFRHAGEYVPLVFSIAATLVLPLLITLRRRAPM